MLLLLLQTVVGRGLLYYTVLTDATRILFRVHPVTQFVRMRYQLSKSCLIPSVEAELLIKELSSFVIMYLLMARQKTKP